MLEALGTVISLREHQSVGEWGVRERERERGHLCAETVTEEEHGIRGRTLNVEPEASVRPQGRDNKEEGNTKE